MLAAVKSELAIIRTMAPVLTVTIVFVCVIMCFGMGSYAGASAACAMVPILVMFSLFGYDDQNGWLRYRAALPLARRDIVVGRYLSIVACSLAALVALFSVTMACVLAFPAVGIEMEQTSTPEIFSACVASTAIVLVLVAIAQPFSIKFGGSKGVRYIGCALMFIGCLIYVASQFVLPDVFGGLADWISYHPIASLAALIVVSLAIYAASCKLSICIFEKKDV
ncbi:ABC-2 transporter permease [uncultured Senegalimassilia sp.]|uniref:ABC-2 transporter permease n=1 Tax=uncultured Senegalimassilia sp. TaxID=1714350 RepID=UPI0025CFEF61|nr:ABC-2 transporter permease [uncultured Senegalimassilia sp.]